MDELTTKAADSSAADLRGAMEASAAAVRAALWKAVRPENPDDPKPSSQVRRKRQSEIVLTWLHKRGEFFHLEARPVFNESMFFDRTRKLLFRIHSDAFQAWLSDSITVNRSEADFRAIFAAVETESLSPGRSCGIEPAAYWASRPGAVYLSSGPGHMVKTTAQGVAVVDNGTDGILFPTEAVLPEWKLTDSEDPFEKCSIFRDMSATAPHGKMLVALWALSLPTNPATKAPLVASGPIGSGKTRLVRAIFELYGMVPRIGAITRTGEGDFWVALDAGGLACFDNADTRIDWFPDALAAAATGGCQEKRRLYTNNENTVMRARSWVAVTSANPAFAADAGLSDRLLVIRLNRREGGTAEAALSAEIAAARDAGLSWMCRTLSAALADTAPVPGGLNARHPDFAAFAVKLGRAMGREDDAVQALSAAEMDKSRFNLENDPIGLAIIEAVGDGPAFSGTAAELVERLKAADPSFELSARKLSKRLAKLWPHFQAIFRGTMEKGHGGFTKYTLTPPTAAGDCGDYETLFT